MKKSSKWDMVFDLFWDMLWSVYAIWAVLSLSMIFLAHSIGITIDNHLKFNLGILGISLLIWGIRKRMVSDIAEKIAENNKNEGEK